MFKKVPVLIACASWLLSACNSSAPPIALSPTPAGSGSPSPTPQLTGQCANDYFPVVQGATWSYARTSGQKGSPIQQTITTVDAAGFTVLFDFSGAGERDAWTCSPAGLADVAQHQTGPGGGPPPPGTVEFGHFHSQGVTVPSDIHAGSAWTQVLTSRARFKAAGAWHVERWVVTTSYRAVGVESVTTPGGTFDAMRIEISASTHKTAPSLGVNLTEIIKKTEWWTKGIGVVRRSQDPSLNTLVSLL